MKTAMYRLLTCVVFMSIFGGLSPSTQPLLAAEDARLPEPPQEKVEQSLTLIRDAYEADYQAAKESGEPEQLIAQLTTLAEQEADPVRKYALFVEAENVAAAHDNYKKAVEILDARVDLFRVDGLALKGELLKRLAGPKVSADLELCDQAMYTAWQAMRSERFGLASEAASLAVNIAKAIDREQKAAARKQRKKDGTNVVAPSSIGAELVKKAAALQSQVTATEKLFVQYGDAVEKAKTSSDSPSANAVIGSYLCFVREDWQAGLPALAKSNLAEFSSLATDEIKLSAESGLIDAQRGFELAGKWWSAAESKGTSAEHESAIKDHAAGFYADVVGRLTGALEKRLASSRLRGLGNSGPSVGNPTVRLSELPIKRSLVGWDRLRVGKLPDVKVNNTVPETAIYAHASSLVVCSLPSSFDGTLIGSVAIAGLNNKIVSPGSCRFRILGDDTLLWESGVITQDKKTGASVVEQFNVRVSGFKTVSLEVDSLGANHSDWSVWVDPVLVWQGTASSDATSPPLVLPGKANERFMFNGHTYWFPEERTNQIEAKLAAEKAGGALVVIDGDDENNFVAKHVRGTSWIGIRKSLKGFVKLPGGVQANYFSWDHNRGQPSNTAGEVAVSTNEAGLWHDHFASDELYYVVEWPPGFPEKSGTKSLPGSRVQLDPGRLTQFRESIGKTISFTVTGAANGGGVWGSNPYTADSQLARAAVHAGVLKPGESGIVNVTILPGQQAYEGTARNGVTTNRWGSYGLSYRIEPDATPTGRSANKSEAGE